MQLSRVTTAASPAIPHGKDARLCPAAVSKRTSMVHNSGHPTDAAPSLDVSARRNIISIVGASTAAVLAGMLPVFPAQAGQLSPLDANYKMVL
mmetsp:Transcript_4698/g.12888  ORF Transcript_4698/g.12888 Transcript_4698/m.12888 type:complete len:93 (+) Transcript_4698:84-362(+)